jgi:hypothetical protein
MGIGHEIFPGVLITSLLVLMLHDVLSRPTTKPPARARGREYMKHIHPEMATAYDLSIALVFLCRSQTSTSIKWLAGPSAHYDALLQHHRTQLLSTLYSTQTAAINTMGVY